MNIIKSIAALPKKERLIALSTIIITLIAVVLAFLQTFGVIPWAACIYLPLMSVSMLLQAYSAHLASPKANRGTVIFSLIAAGIVLLCGIGVIIITALN